MRGNSFQPVYGGIVNMDKLFLLSVLLCAHKLRLSGVLLFARPTPFQSFCYLDILHGKGGSQVGDLYHMGNGRFWLLRFLGL